MAAFIVVAAFALAWFAIPCRCYYLSGSGVGDITGPVADVNLMGYANPVQTAQGVHTRLFARAFIFAQQANPRRRFAYVSMDACMASQLVTLRVVQRLKAIYGDDLYSTDNVAISGTHTHASPAGFLQYLLYDITSLGFVEATFDAMVQGVVTAIQAAHDSLRPALLFLASGDLTSASVNRSPTAYLNNPEEERSMYDTDVDTDMTLVRVADAASGAGRGALGWFAVHCTSLNNTNRLVSGDNKAAAQLAIEWWAAEAELRALNLLAEMANGTTAAADAAAGGDMPNAAEVSMIAAAAASSAALGLEELKMTEGANEPYKTMFHLHTTRERKRMVLASEPGFHGGDPAQQAAPEGQAGSQFLRFEPGFVAAMAQASVGDTSPNTQGAFCLDTGLPCDRASSTCNGRNELCHGRGPAWPDDRTSAAIIGLQQFLGALRLYDTAGTQPPLSGRLDFRSVYLDMTNISVSASEWTRPGRTCPPAMGMSFAAGTTDGPGAFDFTQGDTRGPPLWRIVRNLVLPPSREQQACQAPKPILLDTGQITVPYLWQPRITQISLLRLGRLVIACVPGEFSTMAGRRLKRALKARFTMAANTGNSVPNDSDDPVIVLSGLTGTYSSYITTWEEYQVQRYEGASTLYGPHTLDAYIQEFLRLADAMIAGRPVTSDVQPPDLELHQISLLAPVVLDWVPPTASFGMLPNSRSPTTATGRQPGPYSGLPTREITCAPTLLSWLWSSSPLRPRWKTQGSKPRPRSCGCGSDRGSDKARPPLRRQQRQTLAHRLVELSLGPTAARHWPASGESCTMTAIG
ncbi:hypothetical protein Vretimale_13439 [Volvox reticuliferus]|uniref:Neutral ceramidase n=2 Tax=Volvox reticuliferus TaxID=1737510 RepID=A0A8J4GK95_9CHLO|nr:hypothetical protein Vretimale_13439 [Volvox reticuliferus]